MWEWWSYGLSDFLLFAPRTYYRLFELYNRAIWPAHIIAIASGVAVLLLLRRPELTRSRLLAALLGFAWLWIAWAFHYQRYATINWAATYFALPFALEGLAFLWVSALPARLIFVLHANAPSGTGLILYLLAFAAYPFLAVLSGRPWSASEIFAIAPDPTSIATLGVLLMSQGPARYPLMLVPFFWCLLTGLTLYAMGSLEAWVVGIATLAVLVVSVHAAIHRTRRSA